MILHFKNELAELDRLTEEVRSFALQHALTTSARHDILLALDELLTNVITHGMPNQPAPAITIAMNMYGSEFTAEMRDNGKAFDPTHAPIPDLEAAIDDRTAGGLGIFLARAKMDRVNYRREEEWNVVNLSKKI